MAMRGHFSAKRAILFVLVPAVIPGGVRADFRLGVPQNLGSTINSPYSDGSPEVSADGQELYFDSDRDFLWDIYVSKRTERGRWGTPQPLPEPVNTFWNDSGPSLSADGLSLYFGSDRWDGYGRYDIWVTTRKTKDSPWREPENLGPRVNSAGYENHPSISADGLTLYFGSDRPGGQGYDIWVTTRKTTKAIWTAPVNLSALNSSGIELSPSIHHGDRLLVWDSRVTDRDIWMSIRKSPADPWGPRINLGPVVNTPDYETDPSVTADGSMLYFAAYRPGGSGGQDLWQVPILPVADLNSDGIVDLRDFSKLGQWWQQHDWSVDVGPVPFGDGIVDVHDVAVLAEHWLIDNRLIAHWPLDETTAARDIFGGRQAIVWGGPTWVPEGRIGGAIQLDGLDDRLVADLSLDLAAGPFSVFLWVKGGAPGQVILSQTLAQNWLRAEPATGCLMTELRYVGRTGKTLTSLAAITDGAWHRVGLTWDGLNRTIYVDGVAVAQDTQDRFTGSPNAFQIGAGSHLLPGTFWSGLIDDVRFYNNVVRP